MDTLDVGTGDNVTVNDDDDPPTTATCNVDGAKDTTPNATRLTAILSLILAKYGSSDNSLVA